MGNRLLDWFSVVMAEAKRRRTHNKGKGILQCSEFQMKPTFVSEEDKRTIFTSPSYLSLQAGISRTRGSNTSLVADCNPLYLSRAKI